MTYLKPATLLLATALLACSGEKKADQTAADSTTVTYEQVAAESSAIVNQLRTAAAEINKSCPVQIDAVTRLDSAQALSGTELQYNYTLLTASRDQFDVAKLERTAKPALIEAVKTTPQMAQLREYSITMVYNYRDKDGQFLLKIPVTPADYTR